MASICSSIVFSACQGENKNNDQSGHTHTYSDEFSSDEIYHWHAATCEHSGEISGKEDHSFADGICTVCGFQQFGNSSSLTIADFVASIKQER